MNHRFRQSPTPGQHLLRFCGDILKIRLDCDSRIEGRAFLRTNLGNAALDRFEVIEHVEKDINPGFQAWHNIPMNRVDDFTFELTLMLTETGHFEAKCFILSTGSTEPEWAFGDNIAINVEPAAYCCSNGIYCAFVRQFGTNKNKDFSRLPQEVTSGEMQKFDKYGYALIPPSGTFRDLIKELDHIFDRLGCRILHLLPVNPTPTTYGRMGRYGSPYASLDFTGINPELAEFDRSATPLDQFMELVDAVHEKNGKIFIDIAINHTGWAAKLHEEHPEWFVRNPDGSIHSPGAWGVVWGDLTELDYSRKELWNYLADVFRTWCVRAVDGFRCDAGYMIPERAWTYIIAKVRSEFPDTIFLLEGLGGDPAITNRLLNNANMNWAYSELFQNYSRQQVEGYLKYAWLQSEGDGLMVHYAETHDNNRLAATSQRYALMRTALSALTSSNGAFGFTNGVEWFAQEKIDVHEASALNWNAAENQVEELARLNRLLAFAQAFHSGAELSFLDSGSNECILLRRTVPGEEHPLLIAVNLNPGQSSSVQWNASSAPFDGERFYDMLSGRIFEVAHAPGGKRSIGLAGGLALCLTNDASYLQQFNEFLKQPLELPKRVYLQEAATMVARVLAVKNKSIELPERSILNKLLPKFKESPVEFFRELYGRDQEPPFTVWNWESDRNRVVMVPPGHFLLVCADKYFRAGISAKGRTEQIMGSLRDDSGRFFAIFCPRKTPRTVQTVSLWTALKTDDKLQRNMSTLLYMPEDIHTVQTVLHREDFHRAKHHFVQANGRGALIWLPVEPGALRSRYDSVLLANLNPDFPENRHIMLRRFRIWAIYQARSQEFTPDCLQSFQLAEDGAAIWMFNLPVGNGRFIGVNLKMEILRDQNVTIVSFLREPSENIDRDLGTALPVKIILRPDMEDRSFHGCTKASAGPEQIWPGKIFSQDGVMEFRAAQDRILSLKATDGGSFHRADEWLYMVYQSHEAERGLDPNTDLYSPGYFEFHLAGNEAGAIAVQILRSADEERVQSVRPERETFRKKERLSTEGIIRRSMNTFIVKRDAEKTVIAGYPWFLDWGRDTLIAARGLLAAKEFQSDVRQIVRKFASFAWCGTIPNMICGNNAENRDTSDAPLWLFTVCADLLKNGVPREFLNEPLNNGKTLLATLLELAQGIREGTPNGIRVEESSNLVFSPPHFTWMDTNYPAGTPRQGYPVEIQALWFAAQKFLSEVLSGEEAQLWKQRAETTARSILKYFTMEKDGYFADCLRCNTPLPPEQAVCCDHLRPNQLYVLTLGVPVELEFAQNVLRKCSALLVPGAIRSLADANVRDPLEIRGANGQLLASPNKPYAGHYEGDEDTRRKAAYHNGTAWTWQFPAYCEAYAMVYGDTGKKTARALLASMIFLMDGGCLAQLPEIVDGDAPHTQRGCFAQAWGITEFYRIWKMLHR